MFSPTPKTICRHRDNFFLINLLSYVAQPWTQYRVKEFTAQVELLRGAVVVNLSPVEQHQIARPGTTALQIRERLAIADDFTVPENKIISLAQDKAALQNLNKSVIGLPSTVQEISRVANMDGLHYSAFLLPQQPH